MTRLTAELNKAKQMVTSLKEKEESLKDLLVAEKKKKKETVVMKTGTLSSIDKRPAALVIIYIKILKRHVYLLLGEKIW